MLTRECPQDVVPLTLKNWCHPSTVVLLLFSASAHLSRSGRVTPLLGRFSELEVLLSDLKVKPGSVDAVLLDAGCSSMQMDQAERGFSLSKDGPLDMRMDGDRWD